MRIIQKVWEMRVKAVLVILLGLLLITGTVSASVADHSSTMVSSKEWVIADNYDFSVITVIAKNISSVPSLVPNAQVTFTVDDADYGFFPSPSVTTNHNGVATATFMTRNKSGTAVITATITSSDASGSHTEVVTVLQKIDHDLPQNAFFDNPATLVVGTESILNITLKDRWGNLIDNKNPGEKHSFNLSMPGAMGRGLWDGSDFVPAIMVQNTDENGRVPVRYRIATVSGLVNVIYMNPVGNMVTGPETWIEGLADEVPWYISQVFPSPNTTPANSVSFFRLYYTVKDKYKNPLNGTALLIKASDGTSTNITTNLFGTVFATYGPKDIIGRYTITAIPVRNSSLASGAICEETGTIGYCEQVLEFYNTTPVDMVAVGIPLSMASLDANPSSHGTIQARVLDIKGNAVVGEMVNYSIGIPTYPGGPYHVTSDPSISATSAVTGAGGFSTITFTPGAFVDGTAMDYNATATGEVTVTASWVNSTGMVTSRDISFQWKNYPYLSIYIPPDTCKYGQVGDKINLSISLVGDGAALKPKPIDVILITDVSGSMAGQKIVDARQAGKIFAASMTSQDRVGLESYGWSDYSSVWTAKARDDLPLTYITNTTLATVNTAIDTYTANGNTPMRPAIYNATMLIKNNPRQGAVTAMVLMTDGQWNYCGDPRGISTSYTRMAWVPPDIPLSESDSVVTFAKNNNIRIYTVGLGSSVNSGELQAYAAETGGRYYYAPSSSTLSSVYQQIAGDLKQTAGGNTQVTMNFGTIKVDDVLGGGSITDYLDYLPDVHSPARSTDSTYLNKTNVTPSGTLNYLEDYPKSQDDSAAWHAKLMTFNAGEIKLNETWSATFRLNLTRAGNLEMFGPGSSSSFITFTDTATNTTTTQYFPTWSCPITEDLVNKAFGGNVLLIDNLTHDNGQEILTIRWNTTYTGGASGKKVTERLLFRKNGDPHFKSVPGAIYTVSTCFELTQSKAIDVSDWPDGTYTFRVTGVAEDAPNPSSPSIDYTKKGPSGTKFINLQ